jgi:hypothetical protein
VKATRSSSPARRWHGDARGLKTIPADQARFWSSEWLAGEREADEEIGRGALSPVYASAEEATHT